MRGLARILLVAAIFLSHCAGTYSKLIKPKKRGCFQRLFPCLNPESDDDDKVKSELNEASSLLVQDHRSSSAKFLSKSYSPEEKKQKDGTFLVRRPLLRLSQYRRRKSQQQFPVHHDHDDPPIGVEIEHIKVPADLLYGLVDAKELKDADTTFCTACAHGRYDVAKLLLQRRQVHPSANENEAIRIALHNCNDQIVRLILEDSRFMTDPVLEALFEVTLKIKCQTITADELSTLGPEVFDFFQPRLVREGYRNVQRIKREVVWHALGTPTPLAYDMLFDGRMDETLPAASLCRQLDALHVKSKL